MNVMLSSTTLFLAIVVVGALAYVGSIAFDPAFPVPRALAGYLCSLLLAVIGGVGIYFGASFETPLIFEGAYFFETMHMAWLGLGAIAVVAALLIFWQTRSQR
ncbi:MAG TPA: hypothetical protein VF808_19840 [Ktedonobacterales bacterium]